MSAQIGPGQELVQANLDVIAAPVMVSGYPGGTPFWAWQGTGVVLAATENAVLSVTAASKNALLLALFNAGAPVPILTNDAGQPLLDDSGNVLLQDGVQDISSSTGVAGAPVQIAPANAARNYLLVYLPGTLGVLDIGAPATLPTPSSFFAPAYSDLVLDAFARVQIRPPSITHDHMYQARLSANLLFSDWSNVGMPLLWKVELLQVPLLPGVASYTLPATVIAPLDAFVRQYFTGAQSSSSFAPSFYTSAGSTLVAVQQTAHGLGANQMVNYPVPVSAGGLVLYGPYIVAQVYGANSYAVNAAAPAVSTVNAGGVVPSFASTAGSSIVTVTLPNHGQNTSQRFFVDVPTTVGGIILSGGLQVTGVSDANTFTVQAYQPATSAQSVQMNGGQAQAQTELPGVDYIDYILYPLSRTDYASQPDKEISYRPTTYWFNRQIQPEIVFWNIPDNFGPYVLHLWVMQQPNLAATANGATPDLPPRWYEAFASGLAAKFARKWPPPPSSGVSVKDLRDEAKEALMAALYEDTERVPLFITPGLQAYYRPR